MTASPATPAHVAAPHQHAGAAGCVIGGRFAGSRDLVDMLQRLPAELEDMVLRTAGALTMLLFGRLRRPLAPATLAQAWIECFDADAVHLVALLPPWPLSYERLFVRSHAMAEAAAEMPSADSNEPEMALLLLAADPPGDPEHLHGHANHLVLGCPAGASMLRRAALRMLPAWRSHPSSRFVVAVGAAAAGDMPLLDDALLGALSAGAGGRDRGGGGANGSAGLDGTPPVVQPPHGTLSACFLAASRLGHIDIAHRLLAIAQHPPTLRGAIAANNTNLVDLVHARFGPRGMSRWDAMMAVFLFRNELAMHIVQLNAAKLPLQDIEWLQRVSASIGNAEILVALLRLHGPRQMPLLAANAARRGHLEMLRQMHAVAPDADWLDVVLDAAADASKHGVADWLCGRPLWLRSAEAVMIAARRGDTAMLEVLHRGQSRAGDSAAADGAAAAGSLDAVRWLHAHGAPACSSAGVCDAIKAGHAAVVDFVLSHGARCTAEAAAAAAEDVSPEMAVVLLKHFGPCDWLGAQHAAAAHRDGQVATHLPSQMDDDPSGRAGGEAAD